MKLLRYLAERFLFDLGFRPSVPCRHCRDSGWLRERQEGVGPVVRPCPHCEAGHATERSLYAE